MGVSRHAEAAYHLTRAWETLVDLQKLADRDGDRCGSNAWQQAIVSIEATVHIVREAYRQTSLPLLPPGTP